MRRIKVLVANQSEVVRVGVRALLDPKVQVVREGALTMLDVPEVVMVGACGTARDVYYQCLLYKPDVLVFDDLGIERDMLDFVEKMRLDHPQVKLLWLPAHASDVQVEALLVAGVDGVEMQSCNRATLLRAVQQVHAGLHPVAAEFTVKIMSDYRVLVRKKRDSILSRRQLEVLRLIAEGKDGRTIATTLVFSASTVKREIRHIFDHLGVDDRGHAVAIAKDKRLI